MICGRSLILIHGSACNASPLIVISSEQVKVVNAGLFALTLRLRTERR